MTPYLSVTCPRIFDVLREGLVGIPGDGCDDDKVDGTEAEFLDCVHCIDPYIFIQKVFISRMYKVMRVRKVVDGNIM
jgi:hypothetical protein